MPFTTVTRREKDFIIRVIGNDDTDTPHQGIANINNSNKRKRAGTSDPVPMPSPQNATAKKKSLRDAAYKNAIAYIDGEIENNLVDDLMNRRNISKKQSRNWINATKQWLEAELACGDASEFFQLKWENAGRWAWRNITANGVRLGKVVKTKDGQKTREHCRAISFGTDLGPSLFRLIVAVNCMGPAPSPAANEDEDDGVTTDQEGEEDEEGDAVEEDEEDEDDEESD
jgi:hypothetical protein